MRKQRRRAGGCRCRTKDTTIRDGKGGSAGRCMAEMFLAGIY